MFDEAVEVFGRGGAEDCAFGRDALGNAEAKGRGDKAFGSGLKPVVEFGTSLTADGDGVFESLRGDEGDACAFALEHGVGANGGAVADDDCGFGGELAKAVEYGLAGVVRRGEDFEGDEFSIAQGDAIGEGSAGIDGDTRGGLVTWGGCQAETF